MMKKLNVALSLGMLMASTALANNIAVSGVTTSDRDPGSHVLVGLNLSWQNSWRVIDSEEQGGPLNWDAAWVFIKYRVGLNDWRHGTLHADGHTLPAGAGISVPADGKGAFIYRTTEAYGAPFTVNGIKLRWDYAADGLSDTNTMQVKVFAIEMVHVLPEAFRVGSGGSETAKFYAGGPTNIPFLISSEGAITLGTDAGSLAGAGTGTIPAAFPKGYAGFYGMKTEITQSQYADFLSMLTPAQAVARCAAVSSANRYRITMSGGVYSSSFPYVACNNLSWADLAAYADWAGLRPMTELEYEKACRGSLQPVANEYAWGSRNCICPAFVNSGGSASEYGTTDCGDVPNCQAAGFAWGYSESGPMRVGCFGNGNGSRESTGAGYYGMLELSGNVLERTVTVANDAGRAFTGLNGDGSLSAEGNADVANWPGADATGTGSRGGSWTTANSDWCGNQGERSRICVSDRALAATADATRTVYGGGRCVRSIP